ncbi:MAG: NAD(P)H-dependent oxidoreductase [Cyclobacteriaceae bacterium]
MKVLLLNGSPEKQLHSVGNRLTAFFASELEKGGAEVSVYSMAESAVPLLDLSIDHIPESVEKMCKQFSEADAHIWLTPLYHGGMTGVMKNCLDWLELTSTWDTPYLTNKKIGLVSWADGMQAMQGINNMDAVAKALRAWTLPYAIPICRSYLCPDDGDHFSPDYIVKFKRMIDLLIK